MKGKFANLRLKMRFDCVRNLSPWQLSRVISTACSPPLIHCSAVPCLQNRTNARAIGPQVRDDESDAREKFP